MKNIEKILMKVGIMFFFFLAVIAFIFVVKVATK
jgi:hypothetical protein